MSTFRAPLSRLQPLVGCLNVWGGGQLKLFMSQKIQQVCSTLTLLRAQVGHYVARIVRDEWIHSPEKESITGDTFMDHLHCVALPIVSLPHQQHVPKSAFSKLGNELEILGGQLACTAEVRNTVPCNRV